jgi:pyruvate formate lyase activating enzyme
MMIDADLGDLSSLLVPGRHALSRAAPALPEHDAHPPVDGSQGYVHSFEVVSEADGPGTRFVLFTTGCLLRCLYCHNPDTWHLKNGRLASVERVLTEIAKYAPSLTALDGGLTISGGEPLLQAGFTAEVCRQAKSRFQLHTALDTSGFLGDRIGDEDLSSIDLVLLDIKSWDRTLYRRLTGVDLEPTLAFARRLAALNKTVWIRFVLVPGLTDGLANIQGVSEFAAGLGNVERVDVLPFHQLGRFKYETLGIPYALADTPMPDRDLIERAKDQFRRRGLRTH